MELIFIMVLSLLMGLLIEFTTGPVRIILGAIFLLFFPGYALMAVLFPRKDSMEGVERVVLSFVLSFAIISLTGLALNYTPWGIRLVPMFVALASFICVTSLVALFRRRGLPQSERFEPRLHIKMPSWGPTSRLDMALSIVLVVAVMGAIAALVYVVTAPRAEEHFTDFYLLGSEGMLQDYPNELALGEQAEVTLGIVNHESEDVSYNIQVVFDGETVQEIGPITLADEEEWGDQVPLVPTRIGDDQKVEFLLFKGQGGKPYLTLHLWVDVKQKAL